MICSSQFHLRLYNTIMISLTDIIVSKPFQRLKGKTQLFSPTSNDHYRNRLTHSLEVYAISNSIVSRLNLNIDLNLLGIIALAHDLGHTPFGHEGERTLNAILSGEDDLGGLLPHNCCKKEIVQGFKHNIYSAKLFLRAFHSNTEDDEKLDLIVDGIIKHTKPYYKDKNSLPIVIDYGLGRITSSFSQLNSIENYHLKIEPISTEGRIVAVADEIAQRCSDFSDSMVSKLIMFDEFKELVSQYLDVESISNYRDLESTIRESLINGLIYDEKDNYLKFGKEAQLLNDFIENYIKKRIQGSYLIRTDDSKNCHMIRQVFKALYKKPAQLDDASLVNIYSDIYKSHVPQIKTECIDEHGNIDTIKVAHFVKSACDRLMDNMEQKDDGKIFKNFLANISFYIANMTDSFLVKKYHKLYNGGEE